MHRVVWLPVAAAAGGGRGRGGGRGGGGTPLIGTFTAKLTVNGRSYTQSFVVEARPASSRTEARERRSRQKTQSLASSLFDCPPPARDIRTFLARAGAGILAADRGSRRMRQPRAITLIATFAGLVACGPVVTTASAPIPVADAADHRAGHAAAGRRRPPRRHRRCPRGSATPSTGSSSRTSPSRAATSASRTTTRRTRCEVGQLYTMLRDDRREGRRVHGRRPRAELLATSRPSARRWRSSSTFVGRRSCST